MPYSNVNLDTIEPAMNVTAQIYSAEITSETGLRGDMRSDFVKLNRFLEKYKSLLVKRNVSIPYGIFKIKMENIYGDDKTQLAIIIGQAFLPAPDYKTLVLGIGFVADNDDENVRFIHYSWGNYILQINNGQEIKIRVPVKELSYKVKGQTYDYWRGYEYTVEKSKTGATQLKNIVNEYSGNYLGQVENISEKIEAESLLELTKNHCISLNPEAEKWGYELMVSSRSGSQYTQRELSAVTHSSDRLEPNCGYGSQPFYFDGYSSDWRNHPDYIPCPNENDEGEVEEENYRDIKANTYCKVTAKRCYLYFAQNNQGILLLIGITQISDFDESTLLADYLIPLID